MNRRILIITDANTNPWVSGLIEAVDSLGRISVVPAVSLALDRLTKPWDLIIVDATVVKQVEHLVSQLRDKFRDSRIVVITASPTWTRARAAFEAGAVDYIPNTWQGEKLVSIVLGGAIHSGQRFRPFS